MDSRPLRVVFFVARLDHTSITVLSKQLADIISSNNIAVKIIEWRPMLKSRNFHDLLILNDPSFDTVLISCGALADIFSSAINVFFGKRNIRYFSWLHCNQWEDLKWERPFIFAFPYFLLWRAALYFKDSIVCVSYDVANSLKKNVALRSKVIHNPVSDCHIEANDCNEYSNIKDYIKTAQNEGKKVLLSYGLLRKRKNYIQAVSALVASTDISLIIFGEGPEKEHLLDFAIKNGISNRFAIFPFVRNPSRFCSLVDVYVSNTHSEGFGLANVEAALTGVPVVLPSLSVNFEILSRFENVYFYNKNSNVDFIDVIKRVLDTESILLKKTNPYTIMKFSKEWLDHLYATRY